MVNSIFKSLLSRQLKEREAQKFKLTNNQPRFYLRGFRRLSILLILSLYFLGYQPLFPFPPKKPTVGVVRAQEPNQTQTIATGVVPEIKLPFQGYLSTPFSNWHPGIDLAAGLETPIHPIAIGTVEQTNFGFLGYGNHVIIDHPDGLRSLYGHMDKIYVKVGQSVSTEDVIGTIGLTGFTTGPHTHLEIYKNGQAINPLTLLPPIQNFPSPEYLRPYGGSQTESSTLSYQVKTQPANPKPTETPKPELKLPLEPTPQNSLQNSLFPSNLVLNF